MGGGSGARPRAYEDRPREWTVSTARGMDGVHGSETVRGDGRKDRPFDRLVDASGTRGRSGTEGPRRTVRVKDESRRLGGEGVPGAHASPESLPSFGNLDRGTEDGYL